MHILGIDPGYAIVGYGAVEGPAGPVPAAGVRRGDHLPQPGLRRQAAGDLRGCDPDPPGAAAPGRRGGEAVLSQQQDHGHRRGGGQGRDPAGPLPGGGAPVRIHPHAGQTGGDWIRQGLEAPGPGDDPAAAGSAQDPQAGRRRRRPWPWPSATDRRRGPPCAGACWACDRKEELCFTV